MISRKVKEITIFNMQSIMSQSFSCCSLGIALSSLYVKKFFDKTAKKEALNIAENIKQEMYKIIQEVDWMDNVTR